MTEDQQERTAPEGKRLFIGARIAIGTSNALATAAETLARRARTANLDVRWVVPVDYHITLKYLGFTHAAAVASVADTIVGVAGRWAVARRAAGQEPRIGVKIRGLGAFPSLERAAVLWAGVEDPEGGLGAIAAQLEAAMTGLGFAAEPRPYHPHVTLGRLRENRPLKDLVVSMTEQVFGAISIEAITLFESEMKPSGSVYEEISRIEFKTAERTAERQTRAVDLGASTQSSDPDDTEDGWPRGQGPNH